MTTNDIFSLIADDDLAIDQPTFKASKWKPCRHEKFAEYSENFELVDGRWEGFVSVRRRRD